MAFTTACEKGDIETGSDVNCDIVPNQRDGVAIDLKGCIERCIKEIRN